MNKDKFYDSIKQKADAHAAPVPPDAWDNITRKKKKNPYPVFWWPLSFLLIVAGIFLYVNSNKKTSAVSVATNQHTQSNQTISKQTESGNTSSKELSKTNATVGIINGIKQNNINSLNNQAGNKKTYTEVATNTNSINKDNTEVNHSANQQTLRNKSSFRMRNEDVSIGYDNNPLQKYSTNKKIKFKTTGAEIATDAETNEQATTNNKTNQKNIPNLNNDTNDTKTTLTKNDSSINKNKLIADKPTKPPITDSPPKVLKKDIALNQQKNNTPKNINAGKSIKNPSLILDFSVMPFSPIQRYNMPLYIQRNTTANGINTIYTTNAIKTSLQFSTAFAFAVRKNISKRFVIGAGLQYAQIKENITLSGIDSNTNYSAVQRLETNSFGSSYLTNDTVAATTTGTRIITAVNSYQLFSIPVFIQYTIINNPSFSLAFTGGSYFTVAAKYNNSITGKLQSVYASGTQADNEKNNLVVDVFGGLRFTKLLYKNFLLFAEPDYRYNPAAYKLQNTFLNKNINQAGISFGLSYKIK